MSFRRLKSKPRGVLRDVTLVLGLVFFVPDPRMMTIGAGFFLAGFALHIWSKGCLERNWTVTASGPYRLVRHPFYLANFLIDEGICLGSGNLWLSGLYVVAFTLVYLPTIRNEETYLKGAFGDNYAKYARKIPALVPYRLHAIFSSGGFAWLNMVREKELSRAIRLLAVPAYFGMVAAIFHSLAWDNFDKTLALSVSAAAALSLNAISLAVQRYERSKRLIACNTITS